MPTQEVVTGGNDVRFATRAEGKAILDARARQLLGISGDEFLRQWDDGTLLDSTDAKVITLGMLIPFAR